MTKYATLLTPAEVADCLKRHVGTRWSQAEINGEVNEHGFVVQVRSKSRHVALWRLHGTIERGNNLTEVTTAFRINRMAIVSSVLALSVFVGVSAAILKSIFSGKDLLDSILELSFVFGCLLLAIYFIVFNGRMERAKLSALLERIFGPSDSGASPSFRK